MLKIKFSLFKNESIHINFITIIIRLWTPEYSKIKFPNHYVYEIVSLYFDMIPVQEFLNIPVCII